MLLLSDVEAPRFEEAFAIAAAADAAFDAVADYVEASAAPDADADADAAYFFFFTHALLR